MSKKLHKRSQIWGIYTRPGALKWVLRALPFLVCILLYTQVSNKRLADNPQDKLMPSWGKMAEKVHNLATIPNKRSQKIVFWDDTKHSLIRLLKGVVLATVVSVICAIVIGLFPAGHNLGQNFINVISFIPPVAILPILLVAIGVGETSKVVLIFLGTFPLMTRDLTLYVRHLPQEMITKTMTLGASQWQLITKVIFPLLIPKTIESVRLTLGAGWIFLIVAEGIASSEGLGYRIFQARRYLAMDTIIPYVIWITLLAFIVDFILRTILDKGFKWYSMQK